MQKHIDAQVAAERRFGAGAMPALLARQGQWAKQAEEALIRLKNYTPLLNWLPKCVIDEPVETTALVMAKPGSGEGPHLERKKISTTWQTIAVQEAPLAHFGLGKISEYRAIALENAWLRAEEFAFYGDQGVLALVKSGGTIPCGQAFTDVFVSPKELSRVRRKNATELLRQTQDGHSAAFSGRDFAALQHEAAVVREYQLRQSAVKIDVHQTVMLDSNEEEQLKGNTLFLNQFPGVGTRQNIELQVYWPMDAVLKDGEVVGWIFSGAVTVSNPSLCAVLEH